MSFDVRNSSKFIESLRNGFTIRYSSENNEFWLCTPGSHNIIYKSKFGFEAAYLSSNYKYMLNYDMSQYSKNGHGSPYLLKLSGEIKNKFNHKNKFNFIEQKTNNKLFTTSTHGNHLSNLKCTDVNSLVFNSNGKLLYDQQLFKQIFGYEYNIKPQALSGYGNYNTQFHCGNDWGFDILDDELKPVVMDLESVRKSSSDFFKVKLKDGDERFELFSKKVIIDPSNKNNDMDEILITDLLEIGNTIEMSEKLNLYLNELNKKNCR